MVSARKHLRAAATILVAGGSGSRAGLGVPKQYAPYRGTTLLAYAVDRVRASVKGPIIVVVPAGDETRARAAIGPMQELFFAQGGETRQLSVKAGLEKLGDVGRTTTFVLIHDAARPELTPAVVSRLLDRLGDVEGAIPVLPVSDSIVRAAGDLLDEAVPRDGLHRVQTPQAFITAHINYAHKVWQGPPTATDDAQVARAAGLAVALVEGDEALRKLTFKEDFMDDLPAFRVGTGYDVHRLAEGEELWLCGVKIEHSKGLAGHSDADVAIHAVVDALLGAIGAGDIGQHFPPSDPQWRGVSSDRFLEHAVRLAAEAGYRIGNLDVTIVCEAPKIGPHRDAMRTRLAQIAGVDIGAVNVKATTTERLGFAGRGEGIAAEAVATVLRQARQGGPT